MFDPALGAFFSRPQAGKTFQALLSIAIDQRRVEEMRRDVVSVAPLLHARGCRDSACTRRACRVHRQFFLEHWDLCSDPNCVECEVRKARLLRRYDAHASSTSVWSRTWKKTADELVESASKNAQFAADLDEGFVRLPESGYWFVVVSPATKPQWEKRAIAMGLPIVQVQPPSARSCAPPDGSICLFTHQQISTMCSYDGRFDKAPIRMIVCDEYHLPSSSMCAIRYFTRAESLFVLSATPFSFFDTDCGGLLRGRYEGSLPKTLRCLRCSNCAIGAPCSRTEGFRDDMAIIQCELSRETQGRIDTDSVRSLKVTTGSRALREAIGRVLAWVAISVDVASSSIRVDGIRRSTHKTEILRACERSTPVSVAWVQWAIGQLDRIRTEWRSQRKNRRNPYAQLEPLLRAEAKRTARASARAVAQSILGNLGEDVVVFSGDCVTTSAFLKHFLSRRCVIRCTVADLVGSTLVMNRHPLSYTWPESELDEDLIFDVFASGRLIGTATRARAESNASYSFQFASAAPGEEGMDDAETFWLQTKGRRDVEVIELNRYTRASDRAELLDRFTRSKPKRIATRVLLSSYGIAAEGLSLGDWQRNSQRRTYLLTPLLRAVLQQATHRTATVSHTDGASITVHVAAEGPLARVAEHNAAGEDDPDGILDVLEKALHGCVA